MALRSIANRSLADEVFGQLLGELIGGRWPVGDTLPAERALSATFGVNRHVVREALGRLEQLGLVRIIQGDGTRVLDPRRSAGLDLLAALAEHAAAVEAPLGPLRAALEMRAGIGADVARLCAQRSGLDLHVALRATCAELAACGGGVAVLALDERFWRLVLDGAENFAYQLAFNSLIRGVHAVPRLAVPWLEHELSAGGYRRPIADAIAGGDGDAAAEAAREALEPAVQAFSPAGLRPARTGRAPGDARVSPRADALPPGYQARLTSDRRDLTTLTACAREFSRRFSARAVLGAVIAVATARALAGDWTWHDALVPVVLAGLQPFAEWTIHRHLLHLPPLQVAGRRLELYGSIQHRRHHRDPADLGRVLLKPVEVITFLIQIALLAPLVVWLSTLILGGAVVPITLTAVTVSYLGLLRYEWVHFLIHTPYRPRSRYYRGVWRNHRLHHFKHEGYWLGVSSNLGDRILRTNPDQRTIKRSPTARTLGATPERE